jgi:hypothetical protein
MTEADPGTGHLFSARYYTAGGGKCAGRACTRTRTIILPGCTAYRPCIAKSQRGRQGKNAVHPRECGAATTAPVKPPSARRRVAWQHRRCRRCWPRITPRRGCVQERVRSWCPIGPKQESRRGSNHDASSAHTPSSAEMERLLRAEPEGQTIVMGWGAADGVCVDARWCVLMQAGQPGHNQTQRDTTAQKSTPTKEQRASLFDWPRSKSKEQVGGMHSSKHCKEEVSCNRGVHRLCGCKMH